ncbi:transporter [Acinetobacter baumannii]|nr:transporter [Acinetobacter baumannii]
MQKINKLVILLPIILILYPFQIYGGGLDRSGQSIGAFFQEGNYFEISSNFLRPSVEGIDHSGNKINNIGKNYNFGTGAIKIQADDKTSLGFIYDEPFGAKSSYKGINDFTNSSDQGTQVEVHSQSYTGIVGYNIDNLKIYGGGVYQEIQGKAALRGEVYSIFKGYELDIEKDNALGWLAGISYEKPDIALQTSLTYRSKITYNLDTHEILPINLYIKNALENQNSITNDYSIPSTKFVTPQSLNFDFRTGLNLNYILFGNVRWVDWSNVKIRPFYFNNISKIINPIDGLDLIFYKKDQLSVNLGLGRKITRNLSGAISLGWDKGTGKPISTLGPVNGYKNIGIGLNYKLNNFDISGGIKYYKLGSATTLNGANLITGEFKNNSALVLNLKFGYHF